MILGHKGTVLLCLHGTSLCWAYNLIGIFTSAIEMISEVNKTPNYYQLLDYYIDNINFDIKLEFSNGDIYELERIRDALNIAE